LAVKKITIFMVPEGAKKVKQIRVPSFLPLFLLLFFLASGAFFLWTIQDYQDIKATSLRMARLQEENQKRKNQFMYLAQRIDQVTEKVRELRELDRKLKVMVNLETSEDNTEYEGLGGSDVKLLDPKHAMAKTHKDLVRLMHRSLDRLDREVSLGEHDKAELHKFLESQKVLLASTPSIWPTKGWMSSRFGYRTSPFTGKKEFHKGIDICARINAPIVAPADGIVSHVGWNHGYGKVLSIKHGYGVITKYAHLKKVLVKKGQYLKRGETVALVGNTGRSTGPHLHYEVHLNGVPVDPLRYILN